MDAAPAARTADGRIHRAAVTVDEQGVPKAVGLAMKTGEVDLPDSLQGERGEIGQHLSNCRI